MPRGGRAAIRATWPTVRFLPCGSGRQGATAAGGRVSCGGRWGRTPVPDDSPDQLPSATELAGELGSESYCTCSPASVKLLPMPLPLCHRPGPNFLQGPADDNTLGMQLHTAADIDCSRFVRPTVGVCQCLTQRPLCLLSQDKDGVLA